jgi:hypothetical protein
MIPTISSMISPVLGVYKDLSPGISPPLAAVAALVVVAFAAFVRGPTKENEAVSYLRSGFDLLEKQGTEQRELLTDWRKRGEGYRIWRRIGGDGSWPSSVLR